MNCSDVRSLAGNYVDAELPEEICDRIQRHLLRCAGCREEVDGLRMAVEVLRSTHAPLDPGELFLTSALERLAAELDVTTKLPATSGQLVLGIGAGLDLRELP